MINIGISMFITFLWICKFVLESVGFNIFLHINKSFLLRLLLYYFYLSASFLWVRVYNISIWCWYQSALIFQKCSRQIFFCIWVRRHECAKKTGWWMFVDVCLKSFLNTSIVTLFILIVRTEFSVFVSPKPSVIL